MKADAETHADEDKKKKEVVEARNTADALIYSSAKSIEELGEKVDSATKAQVEDTTTRLRKAMEGEDTEEIKRLSEELTQASHKLAEAMYQQASQTADQQAGPEEGTQAAEGGGQQAEGPASDEEVVDADFEEVKDDKK